MIPKLKAKEIYDAMKGFRVKNSHAKRCAIVCVNEIINSNPHSNPLNTDPIESTMGYWMEVKSELEKL